MAHRWSYRTLPAAMMLVMLPVARTAGAQVIVPAVVAPTVGVPLVERPIAFDVAGRVLAITPTLAARWRLSAPEWPLGGDWTEARLYASASSVVLVAVRVDGAFARYALTADDLARLRRVIDTAVLAQAATTPGAAGRTGFELSEPAGNAFVRNQTLLGLFAYGPATSAMLSNSGAAAGGGYLLAAGASFFVAARVVRNRSVSRAQNTLAYHGGTRGATMGAAVAAIVNANGGPGYGAPVLAGALSGTVAGFRGARGMSDGEASSSGYVADLGALTTLGVAGALGVFDDDTSSNNNNLRPRAKAALGGAIAAGMLGYLTGPRYARRAAYNVTAGDVDVAFASAALGALGVNVAFGDGASGRTRVGVMTAGMLSGALLADRLLVRSADRTAADGTLAQLGAVAGMLMGGGVALVAEAGTRLSIGLITVGGVTGLSLADRLLAPGPDAGPTRGVLPGRGAASDAGSGPGGVRTSRVTVALVPAVTTLALQWRGTHSGPTRVPVSDRPIGHPVSIVRIAF